MATLSVIKSGWHATIQDGGRIGAQRFGLTQGGAADEHAYRWANRLLDNPREAACVEVLLGQFWAEITADALISVTGADLDFRINGQSTVPWSTHRVRAGDQLSFERPCNGLRAYLGIVDGWQTPRVFGSRSVVVRESLGGLDGGPLKSGDQLPFRPHDESFRRALAPRNIPDYQTPLTLQVVAGYQYRSFGKTAIRAFTGSEFRVSQRIDRMGYQLSGPEISCPAKGIISEGIALGAIQITTDGQPIVLLRDRQTIGGYPKIGCVTSLGCSQLAQRGPDARVQFEWVDLTKAQQQRRRFERFFSASEWPADAGDSLPRPL